MTNSKLAIVLSSIVLTNPVLADDCLSLAQSRSNGRTSVKLKKTTRAASCKSGEISITDFSTSFGTGSAGNLTVSQNTILTGDPTLEAERGRLYKNFTVASGVTLTVPSGTVIKTTGTFINRGTIRVLSGVKGGHLSSFNPSNDEFLASAPAHPGISLRSAGHGEYKDSDNSMSGGEGGKGLTRAQATSIRFALAGGGGGAASGYNSDGGAGGGSLVIISKGEITNSGNILANGDSGVDSGNSVHGGGGAGGIIILASGSKISTSSTSTIEANGGIGDPSNSLHGPSGGGGGGIVHLISPEIDDGGTISVNGGAAGALPVSNLSGCGDCSAGAGGGACGGDGGFGGSIGSTSNVGSATAGSNGHIVKTSANPDKWF